MTSGVILFFENISFSLSFNLILLIAGVSAIAFYVWFTYRFTIPALNFFQKYFLIALRVLALCIILILIFETNMTVKSLDKIESKTYLIVDNSRSIVLKDSSSYAGKIIDLIESIKEEMAGQIELFTFGSDVNPLRQQLSFDETSTNFENVLRMLKSDDANLSSIIFVSDGNINHGSVSLSEAEKLGKSFYCIGVGDTSYYKDIEIRKILFNKIVYAGKETTIEATILSQGFPGSRVQTTFFEVDRQIASKSIELNQYGINKINFSYKPDSPGEKKLELRVQAIKDEQVISNNTRIFYVNVMASRKKVLLISGSPTSDLSFFKQALLKNEDIELTTITEINPDQFLEQDVSFSAVDEADILLLIGFPTAISSQKLLDNVLTAISSAAIPYLININPQTRIEKLNPIKSLLPFDYKSSRSAVIQAQLKIISSQHSLLKINDKFVESDWNNLPPVNLFNMDLLSAAGSEVIARAVLRNIPTDNPVILTRTVADLRSIGILAHHIWRWKLQYYDKNPMLFDQFINNCIKWLSVDESAEKFSLRTEKRTYAVNERIEVSAELYDESFNPLSNKEVSILLKKIDWTGEEIYLTSRGDGLYEGFISAEFPGDFTISAKAKMNGVILEDETNISILPIDLESQIKTMDAEFLLNLASSTGGSFNYIDDDIGFVDKLKRINEQNTKEKITLREYQLWNNEWFLFILIILFGLEWFYRKRSGLL